MAALTRAAVATDADAQRSGAAEAPAVGAGPIRSGPEGATGPRRHRGPGDSAVKRTMDVLLSALGLVTLAPAMVVVGLAIRRSMGPPILFRQVRPGRLGRPFVITKFRTMSNALDA